MRRREFDALGAIDGLPYALARLRKLGGRCRSVEYEEVLKRPEQRLATGMDEKDIDGFMAAFASAAEPVEVHFLWRPQLADPDDEIVLEAAVNGRSPAIVTHKVRHFEPAAGQFGLEIVTPGTFLKRPSQAPARRGRLIAPYGSNASHGAAKAAH